MTREEAIKILMGYSHTPQERAALEILIPELTESEDERIYNEIMEFFKMNEKRCIVDNSYTRWIAWLEKQKKQKPAEYLPKEKVYDIMRNLTALSYSERIPINSDEYVWIHKITEAVRSLLDSLQQEQQEVDLEEAVKLWVAGVFLAYTIPDVEVKLLREIVEKSFIAGAEWQKHQMLKDAVERTVKEDAGGYPYIDETELYDYTEDKPLAKKGDKVKIVIVKED